MKNTASAHMYQRAPESPSSLCVQGKNEGDTRSQFLACIMQAMVDSLTVEAGVRASYHDSRRADLPSPWGTIRVSMQRSRSGDWERHDRRRFQTVMESSGKAVCTVIEKAISARKLISVARLASLLRPFVGERATAERSEYIHREIRQFMESQALVDSPADSARGQVSAIQRFVRDQGLPLAAVQVLPTGPRVSLSCVARAADIPLASVRNHGLAQQLQDDLDAIALKSPWSVGSRVYRPTRNRPHGRETFPGIVVDFQQLHVARSGLLDDMLAALPNPADHFETQKLVRWIGWLTVAPDGKQRDVVSVAARRVLSKPLSGLHWDDGKALLDGLVARLDEGDYAPRTRHEYLATFRGWLEAAFRRAGKLFPRYQVSEKVFRSESGRGLISDRPDPSAGQESLRPAILSVATGAPAEAKRRALAHLEDRLERVRMACDKEIEGFLAWRAFQRDSEEAPLSANGERFLGNIINFTAGYARNGYKTWLEKAEPIEVMGAVLAAASARKIYEETTHRALRHKAKCLLIAPMFDRLSGRFPSLTDWCGEVRYGHQAWWVALSRWYVPRWVKLAIELRIQIETGWNRDTVCNLRPEGASFSGGLIELQSIKGKTGELQQKVIESPGKWLRAGLELMLEHQKLVVQHWPHESDKLFTAMIKKKQGWWFGRSVDVQVLRRFVERHQLPPFTREQLRNQVAAGDYLQHDDPHRVQGLLGHGSLKATTTYLRQTVIAVLNRANIAEFRRQLGATIVWAVEGEAQVTARGMRTDEINRRLLFPLSDTAAPEGQPACDAWVREPSQALVIDRVRLEHLVRQRTYYAEHWQRLRAESPERFEKVHRPRIEFTAALWAVVCDSPYTDLLGDQA